MDLLEVSEIAAGAIVLLLVVAGGIAGKALLTARRIRSKNELEK